MKIATEFRSRVVTTSSIDSFTFISAGASAHSIPAANPPRIINGMASQDETPCICRPIAVAAVAPAYSWPSAPMFQYPPEKAKATAAPVSNNGVALTSTSRAPL